MSQNGIFTSYFANKDILSDKYQVVNIATYAPIWFASNYIQLDECKPHNHTVGIWYRSAKDEQSKREYIYEYYKTTLSRLTLDDWKNVLNGLVKEVRQNTSPNKIIILACYERPETFCHRLIFTIFIEIILGIEITELNHPNVFECCDAILIKNTLLEIILRENYIKENK